MSDLIEKKEKFFTVQKLAYASLMAALCYIGYVVFPSFSASGTKIHIGNTFVVLGALILGGVYGGLAGAVGLTIADITQGFAASAPRTFICKLLIGLIVGLIAHKVGHIADVKKRNTVVKWAIISTVSGLLFNCIFEPALKYVWYTLLTPNADKAASAIKALLALTVYTSYINAVINGILAVLFYLALRPALRKLGIIKSKEEA